MIPLPPVWWQLYSGSFSPCPQCVSKLPRKICTRALQFFLRPRSRRPYPDPQVRLPLLALLIRDTWSHYSRQAAKMVGGETGIDFVDVIIWECSTRPIPSLQTDHASSPASSIFPDRSSVGNSDIVRLNCWKTLELLCRFPMKFK